MDHLSLYIQIFRVGKWKTGLIVVLLFWMVFPLCGAKVRPKRILVISTFHLSHRWTAEFNQELREHLQELSQEVATDFLELNAIQRRNIDFGAKFQPYLEQIQNHDYDLVVAILGDAIELVKNNYAQLPPDLPIICIADKTVFEEERQRFPNMTGTHNEWEVLDNVELGLKLMPKAKEIVIITDDVDSGAFLHEKLVREAYYKKYSGLTLLNGKDYTTQEMLRKVAQLPPDSFVIFTPWRNFLKDGFFSLEQVAAELDRQTLGPYLIITDVLLGKGALGGYVSCGRTHGEAAARQILRIFQGEAPRDIPYITCRRELILDWAVLEKYGLSPAALPNDVQWINRPVPFHEAYRNECVVIAIAFLIISLALIGLLIYHFRFRRLTRLSRFLLDHGGSMAKVTYFRGAENGDITFIGGNPDVGIPDDGRPYAMEDWVVPEERERLRRVQERVILEQTDIHNEVFHSEKNGDRRSYHLLVAGKKFADFYIVVVQDITDLEAADRAKSYFLASISHEIRTPLNAVLGFGELLQNDALLQSERCEYAQRIQEAGTLLLDLINDVLDLSRLEAGRMPMEPVKTDISSLLNDVMKPFADRAEEKGLRLEVFCPSLPSVQVDSRQLRQILFNLLGNAVKFTTNGRICVNAKFETTSPETGNLTIMVTDSGCGIPEGEQEKLFQPFVRLEAGRGTQSGQHGTGLGLAICRRLAENMGGELTLKSAPGQGSCFTVILPDLKIEPGETPQPPQEYLPIRDTSFTALLVDDIPLNLKVLDAMLGKLCAATVCAASGAEALQCLKTTSVDMVFTDMWMPEMNGMELADAIRKTPDGAKIRIIAVTADTDAASNFDMSHFDAIIHKPVTLEKLREFFQKIHYRNEICSELTVKKLE